MMKAPIPGPVMLMGGIWVKDAAASESMDPAFDLIKMSIFVRKGMFLVTGVKLEFLDEHFSFSVISWIPGFKVTETYPLNGSEVKVKRRDWRTGFHTGCVHGTGKDNELQLDYNWPDPLAGSGCDVVEFVDPGRMIIHHRTSIGNKSVRFKETFVRAPTK